MAFVRQTNFSGGELSPYLWGRTDLSKFGTGLRRCHDFFLSRHGAAVSRPGTEFVRAAKSITTGRERVRLIPFVYSDSQSYVLEFGHLYVRFHTDGATVVQTQIKLQNLTVAYALGETIIGSVSGAGATIVAIGADYLVLTGVVGTFVDAETLIGSIAGTADALGGTYLYPYEVATPYAAGDLEKLQYVQSGDVVTIAHPDFAPRTLTRVANTSWSLATQSFDRPDAFSDDVGGVRYLKSPLPTPDATHPAREWTYAVTAVFRDAKGVYTESLPATVKKTSTALWPPAGLANVDSQIAVYADLPVTLWIPSAGVGVIPTGSAWVATRIYRGRGDTYGWIGDLTGGDQEFTDVGQEPDYTDQPPRGLNPFQVFNSSNVLLRTEDPAGIAYFQERLVFGGTTERPGYLFASWVGDYLNFDKRLLPVADEALVFELATRRRLDIRSLYPAQRLVIGTSGAIWSIAGHQGDPLKFDSVDSKVVEDIGTGYLPMLGVDGGVLYSRTKGVGVRALLPSQSPSGFDGLDISTTADHLFIGRNKDLVDWCYAEDPWGLVWAARSDGVLLSLTFSPNGREPMFAWAKHDLGGSVYSVCSVPEGDEDAVYVAVLRTGIGSGLGSEVYIERMTSRVRHGTDGAEDVDDFVCLDSALRYSGVPTTLITGLTHLEGKKVWAIAAGMDPQGPFTVVGGAITLTDLPAANVDVGSMVVTPSLVLYVGLLYQPELETLDIASASVRDAQKRVISVGFEVDQAKGLSAGQDFGHLTPHRARTVADGYGPVGAATGLVRVFVKGTYDTGARACLRQTLPLPITVVGLTRELDVGG